MGLITKKMIDIIQEKEKHFPEDVKLHLTSLKEQINKLYKVTKRIKKLLEFLYVLTGDIVSDFIIFFSIIFVLSSIKYEPPRLDLRQAIQVLEFFFLILKIVNRYLTLKHFSIFYFD